MFSEKPSWIRHDGLQIFSIDIQPGGLRIATGGGDHKVRIWNMKSVEKVSDEDQSPKLLATLRDHFGSVNCVRWAKHSRYIASGSDDQVILIHEKRPGLGTTEFGSGEPPDVENWKVIMTLRGHTADVVDLSWSPDDSILASGSLDNTVHVWNMSNGICIAVLRGHSSLVKGVAWDPIGSFIASQSDDKTVIIWRTSDWSLAHKTDGHWTKSLGSTFFRRLGWSPCGHFITTTHGYQKPRHSAPVLERGEWSATFDFLGHNAPIVVVKFNHTMFRKSASNSHEVNPAPNGWANGSSKTVAKELQPYNVIAIGSQDRTITVWTTASARPLFVAKHFFTQSVVDLSWSPDGYSLFACSLDGTVAIFQFEVKELGQRLSDAELDELKSNRYGDARGRQANLAESPAQLLLEAASAKQAANKKPNLPQQNHELNKSTPDTANEASIQPVSKASEPHISESKKPKEASDATRKAAPAHVSSPPKQREYRRPDGRKRIIPEAVGVPSHETNFASAVSGTQNDGNLILTGDGAQRPFNERAESHVRLGKCSQCHTETTARANIIESLLVVKTANAAKGGGNIVENSEFTSVSPNVPSELLSIQVLGGKEDEDTIPVCLEAKSVPRVQPELVGVGNTSLMKETEITCRKGSVILWSDKMPARVTVLAGNANFWAVGSEDGCLQVYTKCGRRALPAMMVGSAAVFLDCDECWKLLLVTKRGMLYVWDLFSKTCLYQDSLSSLVNARVDSSAKDAGTIKVTSARFSRSGSPLVVLATRHAFLYDMNLKCWLRVADDCFPASNFLSSLNINSARSGELANLHIDIGKFMARRPSWNRVTDDVVHTRAHLETQLASAMALKSPTEYRQCLLSYVRFLAREGDESRLREVCENFLGPPTGMIEHTSSNIEKPDWDPCVLGMKKHKLLKEDIFPAIASNRKVQRLLSEFMDILTEYESCETKMQVTVDCVPSI